MGYRYYEMNGAKFRCKNPRDHAKTLEYKTGGAWAILGEYITAKQRKTLMLVYSQHVAKKSI